MEPAGLLKFFSLIPSDFSDGPWIFYGLLPVISWLPVFGGIIVLGGLGLFFLEIKTGKTLITIGYILALVMFGLFAAFVLLFFIAETIGLNLSFIGIPVTILADFAMPPSFNGVGGWICIISAIGTGILNRKLKMPQYEEYLDEIMGIKEEKIEVHKKQVIKGSRKCPKCSNAVPGEQLFCEQCGYYF